jgi:DNA-binding transcriptional ArsR family regulator
MNGIVNDIDKLAKMANMLKAIAHPTRVAILNLLAAKEWMNVTEIHSALNLEQAVASQQLAVLKSKGVLLSRREGKNSLYSIKHEQLIEVIKMIEQCQDC